MDTLLIAISTVGFPTAVAIYLLHERDQTIKRLLTEINNHTRAITELTIIIKERL